MSDDNSWEFVITSVDYPNEQGIISTYKQQTVVRDEDITEHLAFYQRMLRSREIAIKTLINGNIASIYLHYCHERDILAYKIQFKTKRLNDRRLKLTKSIEGGREFMIRLQQRGESIGYIEYWTDRFASMEDELHIVHEELNADELIINTRERVLMFLLVHKYNKTILSTLNNSTLVDIAKMVWDSVPKY